MMFIGWAACSTVGAAEAPPERDLNVPVVLGMPEAFYPYSYVEKGGSLRGFAIDIAEAVARAVKLQIKWQACANGELEDALLSGKIDAIPFLSETKARRALVDFSVPVGRFEPVVVVRKDDKAIHTIADLQGRRVAIGQAGIVREIYGTAHEEDVIHVNSQTLEEFLRQLSAGSYDAVVMAHFSALFTIEHSGLGNLRVLEHIPGYDIRYSMTVRKGDALLLARFNEGLAIIHRTGEFEDIYFKWFGRYEQRAFTSLQVVSCVAAALALICAVATWAFLRQRTLSRRIVRQAQELSEQRSLLAALYDKHPLATVLLDIPAQGPARFVSHNQEAARLYAFGREEMEGRRLDELNLRPEVLALLEEAVARCRANGQAARWEAQLLASHSLLEVATIPLGLFSGVNRLCILTTDITKRRLVDQEIAKSSRLRALGELVGGIAHEFNNLLTPIMATAGMLRAAKQPAVVSSTELDLIDQSAKRAADLTRRLLAFGRKVDDTTRKVRLTEAVANCEALLKTMVDRSIKWENDLPPDLPPITFNPTDFNQIVFNLVLNARDTLLEKAGKNKDRAWQPCLRISLVELPAQSRPARAGLQPGGLAAWQRLTVEDNGLGIAPEVVDRIFEPFFSTKDVGKGTGLGLSTVWHQVNDAGGEISVDSKLGEGTAIHIYLPRWEAAPPLAQAAVSAPRSPTGGKI
jgi:signal transduction histidine kinase/ABC-type amino acid transport substrate-binding protein